MLTPAAHQRRRLFAFPPHPTSYGLQLIKALPILQVNADEHSQLAERFGITGFPTVKWIGRGRTSKDAKE